MRAKPSRQPAAERTTQDEEKVLELIAKGGSMANESKTGQGSSTKNVQLRMPESLIESIDQSLARHGMLRPSRHSWLLQACIEKLERGG